MNAVCTHCGSHATMPIAKPGWRHCKTCRTQFLMRSANPRIIRDQNRLYAGRRGPNPACNCGHCAHCLNLAKWERIWATKYASQEAAYYAQPYEALRASSSLALLAAGRMTDVPRLPNGYRRVSPRAGDVSD